MAPSATLVSKIKVHLKLSISRLRIVQQKDSAIAKQQRRAMAQLLEVCESLPLQGKYESARIRVENIIRSDLTTELHEILELYCELLLARAGLLENPQPSSQQEQHLSDSGLEEAVLSILYATPRTEIKELGMVRTLLIEKYGREFGAKAMEDRDGKVPDRVIRKLRIEPPSRDLVESYLRAIAGAYGIKYGSEGGDEDEDVAGSDDDDEGGHGTLEAAGVQKPRRADLEDPITADDLKAMSPPPKDPGVARSPVSVAPPSPSTDNANPKVRLPGPPDLKLGTKMKKAQQRQQGNTSGGQGKSEAKAQDAEATSETVNKPDGQVPDVDDLEKRFAMLKR